MMEGGRREWPVVRGNPTTTRQDNSTTTTAIRTEVDDQHDRSFKEPDNDQATRTSTAKTTKYREVGVENDRVFLGIQQPCTAAATAIIMIILTGGCREWPVVRGTPQRPSYANSNN